MSDANEIDYRKVVFEIEAYFAFAVGTAESICNSD